MILPLALNEIFDRIIGSDPGLYESVGTQRGHLHPVDLALQAQFHDHAQVLGEQRLELGLPGNRQ